MPLIPGIHVFYCNSSSNLVWLYCDGKDFKIQKEVILDGLPPLARGVSADALGDRIYIYCTCQGDTVHQVSVSFDAVTLAPTFHYQGQVQGIQTQDQTATVAWDGAIHVFYRDSNDGSLKHLSQAVGKWTTHPDVKSGISWGPAAVLRGTGINIAYCESNSNRLRFVWIDQSDNVYEMSPPIPTNGSTPKLRHPAAICLLGNDICVTHHSNDDDHNMFYSFVDQNGSWGPETFMPHYVVYNGPGVCSYGNKIYLFTQGTSNGLYWQTYVGRKWLPQISQVSVGNPIGNVWWSPAAVAVEL